MSWHWREVMAIVLLLPATASGQETEELRVGHWVEIRGELAADDMFVASEIVLSRPDDDEEELLGTITEVGPEKFWILEQEVHVDEETKWRDLDPEDPEDLVGRRVKVSGHYRGPLNFSAGAVADRVPGRDGILGRIDARRERRDGFELDVMRWRVRVPADVDYVREEPLEEYPLLEPRAPSRLEALRQEELLSGRDEDDDIPVTVRFSDEWAIGLRMEVERADERELDLDPDDAEDRIDDELSLRGEVLWTPTDDFHGLVGFRQRWLWRDDDEDGEEHRSNTRIAELYGYWRDVQDLPLDVQLGRQDFDEEREWLWDQNLDAARVIWHPGDWRLQLAAARTLSDGSPVDEATDTYLAYLTWGEEDRFLGAYLIDRRTDLEEDDYPFFAGVRAFGEWRDDHELWAELATVRGYEGDRDLRGWGYDLGTTWEPDALDPWYFSAGYAFGSGDDDPTDGVDRSFRQTGLHDNNSKLGGVTSFRYYGELVEPELSNLGILTLGVGRRFGQRHSLDLVWHAYRQDEAADFLRDSELDRRPDGVHRELGTEIDLVFGSRVSRAIHVEAVLARFDPGAAFPDDSDPAWLGRIQIRYRF